MNTMETMAIGLGFLPATIKVQGVTHRKKKIMNLYIQFYLLHPDL